MSSQLDTLERVAARPAEAGPPCDRAWRGHLWSAALDGATVLYFVFALFPILWMVLVSLKSESELFTSQFIFHPTLESYAVIFGWSGYQSGSTGEVRTDFPHYFLNSIILSTLAVVVSLVVGVPAAYAFARFKFRFRDSIAFTLLSFRFAPELLVIIPLYVIFRQTGLYDSYVGMIWVYQLVTLPLLVWVLRTYFEELTPEIENAAFLDGYRRWQVFLKVIIPLVKPGVASASLLAMIFAWNNFVFPLILSSSTTQTVTVSALSFLSSEQARYNEMAAASLVAALPVVVLAFVIQRFLVRGLTFGAVKG